MKNKKSKLITLMLATMLGAATYGGALIGGNVTAGAVAVETEKRYSITDIFSSSNASMAAGESDATKLTFSFSKEGNVTYRRRDLAFRWLNTEGAEQFFNMKFTLDSNFEKVEFVIESNSAWATSEGKTTNTIKLTNEADGVKVQVNEQTAQTVENATAELTLALAASTEYGEFGVTLNGTSIGKLENVGENYAEYASSTATTPIAPLVIKTTPKKDNGNFVKTSIVFSELNGQSFALTDGKITDNAEPVLVVNEDISGFVLGTGFSLDYVAIDVLDEAVLIDSKYYQYDPDDKDEAELEYKKLEKSTSTTKGTFFAETVYNAGTTETPDLKSVYETIFEANDTLKENKMEFVSIKFILKDEAYNTNGVEYSLSNYATETVKPAGVTAGSAQDIEYIKLDRNTEGAYYTFLTATEVSDGVWENVKAANYDEIVAAYQAEVEEAAKGVLSGASDKSDVYLPKLNGLIADNNGYKNLKFVVSYQTSTSTTPTSGASVAYDKIKLRVSTSGDYEFKIVVTDKAGNPMKYANEKGELVEVTTSNVWDIEEIPSFTFHINNASIKVEDDSSTTRKESQTLNKTYAVPSFGILGATSYDSKYFLYKVNFELTGKDVESALSAITYEKIAETAATLTRGEETDEEFYLLAYKTALAEQLGIAVTDFADSDFVQIKEYNSAITKDDAEWEVYNKYEWNATAKSFNTVEEGRFLVLGIFTDKEVSSQKAAAYKLVLVEDPEDVIKGETEWLKNNIASVILFGVAAVMLVLIVILLLIKPSDETLEDVDATAEKKEKTDEKEKK